MSEVFFESRKKGNKLVEPESIAKHAQLRELEQSEPSLSTIELVEKCFGPQTCSHVFGFGGGVKAKDMKEGKSLRSELLSKLRTSEEQNQLLKDRVSTLEDEMKEMKKLKELLLAHYANAQPSMSHTSRKEFDERTRFDDERFGDERLGDDDDEMLGDDDDEVLGDDDDEMLGDGFVNE